jgi:hypothetical protein
MRKEEATKENKKRKQRVEPSSERRGHKRYKYRVVNPGVNMTETPFAKKLLDYIIQFINPQKTYPEIIRRLVDNAKREINNRYNKSNSPIFGVFGKDDTFVLRIGTESGKKLRARIARKVCKEFQSVVVTGDAIYYYMKKSHKIKNQSIILANIRGQIKREDNWRTIFSRIVGKIPDSAIFLIDKDRSASILEEESFHETKSLSGIAVVISDREIKRCRYLKILDHQRSKYGKCDTQDYDACCKPKSRCILLKLKINKTTAEPFIRKASNSCIIVDDASKIEDIVITELRQIYSKTF